MGFRITIRKELFHIASDLGVYDPNRVAHRGCIARFGTLTSATFSRPERGCTGKSLTEIHLLLVFRIF